MHQPHLNRGVTLLELMVVVFLIGILSLVGWNYYNKQLNDAKRGDAVNALLRAAAAMQQCYARQVPHSYIDCSLPNFGSGPCSDKNRAMGDTTIYSPKCAWTLNNGVPTQNRYTLSATRSFTDDDGNTQIESLSLDNLGRKTGPWPR
ncbi:MAG: prepilin-type N-terminal cleavage/methylation domain-containing protein [Gammaproteobacteria bacterium]|nr:prepilin-type N-terminal cleavage/methylation domain-containing protein [Gammaproteobacteria bacterium]